MSTELRRTKDLEPSCSASGCFCTDPVCQIPEWLCCLLGTGAGATACVLAAAGGNVPVATLSAISAGTSCAGGAGYQSRMNCLKGRIAENDAAGKMDEGTFTLSDTVKEQRETIAEVKAKWMEVSSKLDRREKDDAELEKQRTEETQRTAEITKELKSQIAEITKELESLKAELQPLRKQLAECQAQRDEAIASLKSLEAKQKQLLSDFETQNQRLKEENDSAAQQNELLKENLKKYQEAQSLLQSKIDELQKDKASSEANAEELEAQLKQSIQQQTDLEKQLEEFKAKLSVLLAAGGPVT